MESNKNIFKIYIGERFYFRTPCSFQINIITWFLYTRSEVLNFNPTHIMWYISFLNIKPQWGFRCNLPIGFISFYYSHRIRSRKLRQLPLSDFIYESALKTINCHSHIVIPLAWLKPSGKKNLNFIEF